jgi:hypothetical protein
LGLVVLELEVVVRLAEQFAGRRGFVVALAERTALVALVVLAVQQVLALRLLPVLVLELAA